MSWYSQTYEQRRSPLGNGKVIIIYHYIKGDRYIQVNFAENIRQLKI